MLSLSIFLFSIETIQAVYLRSKKLAGLKNFFFVGFDIIFFSRKKNAKRLVFFSRDWWKKDIFFNRNRKINWKIVEIVDRSKERYYTYYKCFAQILVVFK